MAGHGKGSGTLFIPKCPREIFIVGMWNNCPHPFNPRFRKKTANCCNRWTIDRECPTFFPDLHFGDITPRSLAESCMVYFPFGFTFISTYRKKKCAGYWAVVFSLISSSSDRYPINLFVHTLAVIATPTYSFSLFTRIHETATIPDGIWQQYEGPQMGTYSPKSCLAKTLKIHVMRKASTQSCQCITYIAE